MPVNFKFDAEKLKEVVRQKATARMLEVAESVKREMGEDGAKIRIEQRSDGSLRFSGPKEAATRMKELFSARFKK